MKNLTYKTINYILKHYDIVFVKNVDCGTEKSKDRTSRGLWKPDEQEIQIKKNQSPKEEGITILHEFLHVHHEEVYGVKMTETQIEQEAQKCYQEHPELLKYFYSFKLCW